MRFLGPGDLVIMTFLEHPADESCDLNKCSHFHGERANELMNVVGLLILKRRQISQADKDVIQVFLRKLNGFREDIGYTGYCRCRP